MSPRGAAQALLLQLVAAGLTLSACSSDPDRTSSSPSSPPPSTPPSTPTSTPSSPPSASAPSRASETPLDLPRTRPVTDRREVLGRWRVVQIAAGPIPRRAVRWVFISKAGRAGISFLIWDGVNSHNQNFGRIENGYLGGRQLMTSTLVGCDPPSECERPSGFGVAEAARLYLTPDGELVLLDWRGVPLAVYERAPR